MSDKTKLGVMADWAATITMISMIASGAYFSWRMVTWADDRESPLVASTGEAINSPIVYGDELLIQRTTQFTRQCPGEPQRMVVQWDETTAAEGPIVFLNLNLESDNITTQNRTMLLNIPLPSSIYPGHYIYRERRESFCNPLQKWLRWPIETPFDDVFFTVVAGEGKIK